MKTIMNKWIVRTPLIPFFSADCDRHSQIYLKPENLQTFGSYKIRGIASVIKESDPNQLKLGLSAASAGNMAQAVAFAAQKLGVPCKIYVPDAAPEIKKSAIARLGAELIQLPFEEVWAYVRGDRITPKSDGIFIHPALCNALLKGYETLAHEMIEDLPDLDAIIIPFGVGGLSLGVARVIHCFNPRIAIYTCEPETASPLKASIQAGKPASIRRIPSFVDAIGTPEVLPQVFQQLYPILQDSLVMSLDEIKKALSMLLFQHKMVCEGAAACSLAAALKLAKENKHHKIVTLLSGGNLSKDVLSQFFIR